MANDIEKTAAELTTANKRISELESDYNRAARELNEANAELEKERAKSNNLSAENMRLIDQVANKDKEIAAAEKLNTELQTQLNKKGTKGSAFLRVEFQGEKYEVLKEKFHIPKVGDLTAKDLQTNKEALGMLISMKSKIVRKVDK